MYKKLQVKHLLKSVLVRSQLTIYIYIVVTRERDIKCLYIHNKGKLLAIYKYVLSDSYHSIHNIYMHIYNPMDHDPHLSLSLSLS